MGIFYPATGFHFAVLFELFPQTDKDMRFQEVQGLTQQVEVEELIEGGENRFTHQLPVRTKYQSLVLKRGMFIGSGLLAWAQMAIENQQYSPVNATISLLNEFHLPIAAWYVTKAYPVKWSYSNFNAQANSLVIESIELKFQYYRVLAI